MWNHDHQGRSFLNLADVLALHRRLIEIPSVSGNEAEICAAVLEVLDRPGIECQRVGNSVIARKGKGRRLVLNSHLDSVPATSSWTKPAHRATVEGERVYGLGSNDALASVAAMIGAFMTADPKREVALILGEQEETTGLGTSTCLKWLQETWPGEIAGAIVGEPTELQIGVAQKGLLILELHEEGTSCHAARATELGAKNPIFALARDLVRLEEFELSPTDPYLGAATLQATVIKGGDVHNRVPDRAEAVLDCRTVPTETHDQLIARISDAVEGEIKVRSKRLEPYACDPGAEIVRLAQSIRPESKPFGSATMSDQVFFQGVPCIKCGPGVSARSHTANEFVLESEIAEGFEFYKSIVGEF